jgi:antirestriction protein ArdC
MKKKLDVHEEITNRIVAAVEKGAGEFKLPWHRPAASLQRPVNVSSGKPYRGINVVSLWVEAQTKGYELPVWGTYKAFQEKGAQVRKGEKASLVVFYKELEFANADAQPDDDATRSVWMARGYWVFNAEQCDGYPIPVKPQVQVIERNAQVDAFVAGTGADVRYGGHSAFYSPTGDFIQMPDAGLFTGTDTSSATEAHYSTLLHELVHLSGHKNRLDRNFTGKFTTNARAHEELVAELGAAFLCADLAVTPHLRDDHAQYISHWLHILRGDSKAIFAAAAAANRAAEYLHGLQLTT